MHQDRKAKARGDQAVFPRVLSREVTRDSMPSTSVKCSTPGKRPNTECPHIFTRADHSGMLTSKFQTPKRKADVWHTPRCLCSLCGERATSSQLGTAGALLKTTFSGPARQRSLSKDRHHLRCFMNSSLCRKQ